MGACDWHRLIHRQQEISKLLLPVDKSAVFLKADTGKPERAGGEVRLCLPAIMPL